MRSEQEIFGEDLGKTDLSVGQILCRAREYYGRTLDECSNALRIRAQQLEAIEKEEWHRLPGKVYAIGFVRSYAEYLDLDGEKMVRLLKVQSDGVGLFSPRLSLPGQQSSDNRGPGWLAILLSFIFIILSIYAGTFIGYGKNTSNDVSAVLSQTYGGAADQDGLAEDLLPYTQNIPILPLHYDDDDIAGFVENVKQGQYVINDIPRANDLIDADEDELSTLSTRYQGEGSLQQIHDKVLDSGKALVETNSVDKKLSDSGLAQLNQATEPVDKIITDVDKIIPAEQVKAKNVIKPRATKPKNVQESENLTRQRAKSRVIITAKYDSWVEVTIHGNARQAGGAGRKVFARVLRKGDIYYVPKDKGRLRLATGNAGGLLITVDGKSLGALGEKGDIMRGIDLEPAALIRRLR